VVLNSSPNPYGVPFVGYGIATNQNRAILLYRYRPVTARPFDGADIQDAAGKGILTLFAGDGFSCSQQVGKNGLLCFIWKRTLSSGILPINPFIG
jgi:hypothetical protein